MESRYAVTGKNRRLKRSFPTAVVISAGGSPGAFDMVRCLRREGIKSCVMSSQSRDIAFYSRGCADRVVLPPFEKANYEFIADRLLEYAGSGPEKPVLYYASDPELRFVWEYRHTLEPFYRFLLPTEETFESLFSKVLFAGFAERHGLPVPESIVCRDMDDLHRQMSRVPFPCIVKPAFSEQWKWKADDLSVKYGPYKSALRKFEAEEDLTDFCQGLPQNNGGFLVQKYVEGRDESIYSFHGYFDKFSNCRGWFVGRKIRTYPMHTGGSSFITTLNDKGLADMSIKFLQEMGYRGIVKIDYKRDAETGAFRMFEVNTRYNLWQVLGMLAGINLAALAFFDQAGFPVEDMRACMPEKKLLYFKQDLRAFMTGYAKTGEWTLGSYLRSLAGRAGYRVLDFRDPVPFIVSLSGFLFRNVKRVVQKATRPVSEHSGEERAAGSDGTGLEIVQGTWVEK